MLTLHVLVVSLCCESPDEAKTLIPSLSAKIDDEKLDGLLKDLTKRRTFMD